MGGNFHTSRHPLVAHKLAQMRNEQLPYGEFRRLMRELGMLMAYEVTHDFPTKKVEVSTFRGKAHGAELQEDRPVIVPILRSGLIMAEGVQEVISRSFIGHIGIHREKSTTEATEYFSAIPVSSNRVFIVVDPVIATGITMHTAIETLHKNAVAKDRIRVVSIISSKMGMELLKKWHKEVSIYCAAVDEGNDDETKAKGGLNAAFEVVPGMGSVSRRLFGFSTESALS